MSSRHPVFKTNYLKTNLLKQIKNIFPFQRAKLVYSCESAKSARLKSFSIYIMPPIPGAPLFFLRQNINTKSRKAKGEFCFPTHTPHQPRQ